MVQVEVMHDVASTSHADVASTRHEETCMQDIIRKTEEEVMRDPFIPPGNQE